MECFTLVEVKRDSFIPVYEQVVEYIQQQIQNNIWKKGQKIFSEEILAKNISVSRGTVKKAINELIEKGILIQKQGKGTFVVDQNINFPLTQGLISFSEALKSQNINFSTEILSLKIEKAPKNIAKSLNITINDNYLFLQRIRRVNDEVIMFIENNINISLVPNIEHADFENESLFNIIEMYTKKRVSHSTTRFAAIEAVETKAKHFNIKIGAPLLYQEQLVHLEDDNVIELGKVWLKSNKFYLGSFLQRR